jgi:undecaprenyl diphosphate synthase
MLLGLEKKELYSVLTRTEMALKDEEKQNSYPQEKHLGPGQKIYTDGELDLLDPSCIPNHVAIIMDGNRRWEKENHMPLFSGHWRGAESLTRIVRAGNALGIGTLTAFAFSTENWTRSNEEVEALMRLFEVYLIQQRRSMQEEGVRFHTIGDLSLLPQGVQKAMQETKEATRDGKNIDLILAINYGGRDEIVRAARQIVEALEAGKISKREIGENLFSQYLDTARWPDPDLLIRTSGERRLSNFLLWQTSYSELYIEDVFWPDFSEKHFLQAILDYQKRKRRLGGT